MTIYNVIENPSYNTSYTGHIAGALAGLLLGVVLLENRRVVTWEVNLQRVTVSLYIILLFKVLVLLQPGENELKFDFLGVKDTIRIFYRKVPREHFVR